MYYIYSSRCQPLNLLNEKELLWLSQQISDEDKIIIGIVNPNPTFLDPSDKATTWTRFKKEFNPLNYWERYKIVSDFVNSGILKDSIAGILPLPRPSTNMERARNYLPIDRVMCLPIVQENDIEESKELGLQQQGEKIFKIPSYSFSKKLTIISPELIFCLIAIGDNSWQDLVSSNIKDYLLSLDIENRVLINLNRKVALETLRKIYKRTANADEKYILYNILKIHLNGISVPTPEHIVSKEKEYKIDILKKEIDKLYMDITSELPMLSENAPMQFEQFKVFPQKLFELKEKGDNNIFLDESEFSLARQEYINIEELWKKRKKIV